MSTSTIAVSPTRSMTSAKFGLQVHSRHASDLIRATTNQPAGHPSTPATEMSVADEHTSLRLEQPHEIGALHAMLSSPTLCTQGI